MSNPGISLLVEELTSQRRLAISRVIKKLYLYNRRFVQLPTLQNSIQLSIEDMQELVSKFFSPKLFLRRINRFGEHTIMQSAKLLMMVSQLGLELKHALYIINPQAFWKENLDKTIMQLATTKIGNKKSKILSERQVRKILTECITIVEPYVGKKERQKIVDEILKCDIGTLVGMFNIATRTKAGQELRSKYTPEED